VRWQAVPAVVTVELRLAHIVAYSDAKNA